MITIFKVALNSESSALLKMSDMVGIELSQKPRQLIGEKLAHAYACVCCRS